jgi:hypothetical protein
LTAFGSSYILAILEVCIIDGGNQNIWRKQSIWRNHWFATRQTNLIIKKLYLVHDLLSKSFYF